MLSDSFHLIKYLTEDRSKGVLVWVLNIGAEKYWNQVNQGVIASSENKIVNRVEEMNLLLCREQDILILREMPDASFLAHLKELGFSVPKILVPEQTDPLKSISELILEDQSILRILSQISKGRDDVFFVPYATTRLEEQIAEICQLRLVSSSSTINARINDKIYNREIAEQLGFHVSQGKICHSVDEIKQEYARLVNQPPYFERVIIKEPFGASGKGLYIVDSEDKLNPLLSRIARLSRNHPDSKWLVEGWYAKKKDINYQIYIAPDGSVDVFSIKEQILRDTIYIGSRFPATINYHERMAFHEYGRRIGKYLYEQGYVGVAGVDSMITLDDTLIPIIEINGRFTLSTYISFVQQVFGEGKFFSRYFRVISPLAFDYSHLCSLLEKEGLLYSKKSGEGVFVYTAGTLPLMRDQASGNYLGRIFTLVIARNWERVEEINDQLERLIHSLSIAKAISRI